MGQGVKPSHPRARDRHSRPTFGTVTLGVSMPREQPVELLVLRVALAVLMSSLSACGGNNATTGPTMTTPTTGVEVGSYALISLNGGALPTSIPEGSTQIEVISGTLTLAAGGTVRTSTTYRSSAGATPVTNEVSGTYTVQGSTLSFSYSNGGRTTATLNGNTLQMVNEGVVWLYQRA